VRINKKEQKNKYEMKKSRRKLRSRRRNWGSGIKRLKRGAEED
jgi:hypothetical protein